MQTIDELVYKLPTFPFRKFQSLSGQCIRKCRHFLSRVRSAPRYHVIRGRVKIRSLLSNSSHLQVNISACEDILVSLANRADDLGDECVNLLWGAADVA